MANSMRLEERPDQGQCEDFGLTYDLVSAEAMSIAKAVAERPTRLDDLAATIETSIIPRLLLSHGVGEKVSGLSSASALRADAPLLVTPEAIEEFAALLLSTDNSEAVGHVEAYIQRGMDFGSVMLDLLAPAARLMGDMWSADRVSFLDVTLGLSRIQQILRQLRSASDGRQVAETGKGRALLLPVPNEQHTLGLRVVEEFLLRDGWEVRANLKADLPEMLDMVSEQVYDFVGLSISGERLLPVLQSAIREIRKCSRNRSVRIMVGGVVFVEHPEYVGQVEADAAILDAQQAVFKANEWFAPAAFN